MFSNLYIYFEKLLFFNFIYVVDNLIDEFNIDYISDIMLRVKDSIFILDYF